MKEKDIKWNDLIELILTKNNGTASLNLLYEQASKYKLLPSGDWQKTLRGVLYRDVNKGRFKKIGLGVYALPNYEHEKSAYSYALKKSSVEKYLRDVKNSHSSIEGMLLELGNYFEYITYTSDRNKYFDGKKLGELCSIKDIPNFTYSELKSLISKCDTIWFLKNRLPFPKYIFEIESTTDFINSMFKMYQLLNFEAKFILVAPQKRWEIYQNRVNKEPFANISNRFYFRSFEDVARLYFNSVEHYELKSNFLS